MVKRALWYLADIVLMIVIYVIGRAIMEYNGYTDIQWPSYILGIVIGAVATHRAS